MPLHTPFLPAIEPLLAWLLRLAGRGPKTGAVAPPHHEGQPPATAGILEQDPTALLWRAMDEQQWAWALALAGRADPCAQRPGSPCPLLLAAWAGQAALVRALHAAGGNPGGQFQGKGVLELAMESMDTHTFHAALVACPAQQLTEQAGVRLEKRARGLGLGDAVREGMARERRRRLARGLDLGLPPAGDRRERQRL